MEKIELSLLKDLYSLWKPVFPYLSLYIKEIYGKEGGDIIEVGPFCGSIFSMISLSMGETHTIATFPRGMGWFYRDEMKTSGIDAPIRIFECDDSLSCIRDNRFDLVIFRGALFFPDFFNVDYSGIFRILKKGGVGLIGGGFGRYTPEKVLKEIGKKSKELNLAVGKREVSPEEIVKKFIPKGLYKYVEISKEGGLWTILRR